MNNQEVSQADQLQTLQTLTEKERSIVEARFVILRQAEAFLDGNESGSGLNDFTRQYDIKGIPLDASVYRIVPGISVPTIHRWRKAFKNHGKVGLVPLRGERSQRAYKSHWDEYPQQLETVKGFIYKFGKHVKASHVWRELQTRFPNQKVPSRRTVERYINQWFKDNPQLADKITDPSRWKGRHLVSIGKRDQAVHHLAQVWEIDTTPSDLLLKYEKPDGTVSVRRYALLGVIEVYSRMALLRVVPVESTHAVLSTLRHAILQWRRFPEKVRTDQGSVYTSNHFNQILDDLGIIADVLPPGSPERKPFIERFFGTFNGDLLPQLPGYVGKSVAERRQLEARRKSLVRSGVLKKEDVVELALTSEEFQHICDNWLIEYNQSRKHSALQCTPQKKAQQWLDGGLPIRGIPEGQEGVYEVLLAQLLAPAPKTHGKVPGVRVVRKGSVRVDGIAYAAPEFGEEWNGCEVICRYDEADVSRLFVYDLSMQFICIAQGVDVPGGISRLEAQQMVKKAQAEYLKRMKFVTREVLSDFKIQRVAQFMDKNPAKSSVEGGAIVERLTPTMENIRDAAMAIDEMLQPNVLQKENEQALRESIMRHEQDLIDEKEFTRPEFWDSDAHRFHWCCEAETKGSGELLTEADIDFCTAYKHRLGLF